MKTTYNWETFVDSFFLVDNLEKKDKQEWENGLRLTFLNNGIYIEFELDKTREKINKLEFGSYQSSTNDKWPITYNFVKGVLDKSKPYYITFLQTSYFGEYGEQYELTFNEHNQKLVTDFLKIPCNHGWSEEHYKYKGEDYKTKVFLAFDDRTSLQFEILLMNVAEQDIPLFGDNLGRRVMKSIYDLDINKRNRDVRVENRIGLMK